MLTDPFAVTYDGNAKSLPRVSVDGKRSRYKTADGEFEIEISHYQPRRDVAPRVQIQLLRRLPDPTPGDAFDAFREIKNGFGLFYVFDPLTRAEASVDIPRLRTALLNTVDTTLQGRLIAGER